MSTETERLHLFKYDPEVDGEEPFSISRALNENWDKIDEEFGNYPTTEEAQDIAGQIAEEKAEAAARMRVEFLPDSKMMLSGIVSVDGATNMATTDDFFFLSSGGYPKFSKNGIDWNTIFSVGKTNIYTAGKCAAAFNPSQSSSHTVYYTIDGEKWTSCTFSTTNIGLSGIFYANDILFIHPSGSFSQLFAINPANNTVRTITLPATDYWQSVIYYKGKYFAFGLSYMAVANDYSQSSWTRVTQPISDFTSALVNNVLFGFARSGASNVLMRSEDGETWTTHNFPVSGRWQLPVYGNNLYLSRDGTVSNLLKIAVSSDGKTWSYAQNQPPITSGISAIVFYNGYFIGYENETLFFSADAGVWETHSFSAAIDSVFSALGCVFVHINNSTVYYYSQDLITWIEIDSKLEPTNNLKVYSANDRLIFTTRKNSDGCSLKVLTRIGALRQNGNDVTDEIRKTLEISGSENDLPATLNLLLELAAEHEERLCMMELGIL